MKILLAILFIIIATVCSAQSDLVLAKKGDYKLTQELVDIVINSSEIQLTADQQKLLTDTLIQAFHENPKGVIDELKAYKTQQQNTTTTTKIPEVMKTNPPNMNPNLAEGHKAIRKILGNDIGQMKFDSNKAIAFRQYLTNASFYNSTNSFSGGVTGSGSTTSSSKAVFCQDGTFLHTTTTAISISVPGMGGFDKDVDEVYGYWEVASMDNGMLIILLYSTQSEVLAEFPNGFMPFPVKNYDQQYLISADDERYEKSYIGSCN